jgi:hypothetical protein
LNLYLIIRLKVYGKPGSNRAGLIVSIQKIGAEEYVIPVQIRKDALK